MSQPCLITIWRRRQDDKKEKIMRAITPDKPSTADMTTLIDEFFRQVSRDVEEGASGPEAFTLLLRRLMTHFDRVDTGEGYTRLHRFGVHGDAFLRF